MTQKEPPGMNKIMLFILFTLILASVERCYRAMPKPKFVLLPPLQEAPPLQDETCDSQNIKISLEKLLLGGGKLLRGGGESILIINTRDNERIPDGYLSSRIDPASIETKVNTSAPIIPDSPYSVPYSVPYTVLHSCTVQVSTSVEGKIIARNTVDYEVVKDEEGGIYARIGKKGFSPAKGTPRPN